MMKQIFSRLKASKSTDKEIIGGSMPSGLNQFSDSVTADSSRQPPTLSATGLGYKRGGDNVGLTNLHINDALFSSSFQPLLPSFRDVPSTEKQSLLMQKLNLCCTLFDFTDPTTDVKEKAIKKQTLQEIVQYIVSANGNGKFPADIVAAITVMVSSNIFRSLRSPPREKKVIQVFDLEDDEPSRDPAWPHLQFVYQLFLKFIESPGTDAKLAKRYINHYFIRELLELFNTEDPRERDYLKTVLHRIYGKFMVYRPFIRRSINNIFYQFIYETEKHNGIAELLEIFGSIINGFALPLKEEHKLFLVRTLIPLHKPRSLSTYHEQLSYCVTQFVEKDCKLADTVIRGLVKYWPISNSPKEGLFLEELAGILSVTQLAEFQRCMVPLFYQIARCLSSSQFQVAERTVCLWNNYHIEALFNEHIKEMLPIILPALEENANGHWNERVQNLSLGLRTLLSDRDPELFAECLQQYEEGKVKQEGLKQQREAAWKRLDDMASTKVTAGEAVLVSPALLPQSSLI